MISGCAEPALVASADDEPVISVPSSQRFSFPVRKLGIANWGVPGRGFSFECNAVDTPEVCSAILKKAIGPGRARLP